MYNGPVLTLNEAALGGQQVQHIEIMTVREGSQKYDPLAEWNSRYSTGLEAGPRGQILGTLPGGFGEVPGRWRVRVVGPAGSEAFVDTEVEYSDGGGDCPSYGSDGSNVEVMLTVPD